MQQYLLLLSEIKEGYCNTYSDFKMLVLLDVTL